jgi:hypothetical protein
MSMQEDLRALAAGSAPAAPFDFEVFEQRRAAATVRRRSAVLGAAGSIAALAFVSIIALVTQSPQQLRVADVALPAQTLMKAEFDSAPALIDLDQFDLTTELEDHIAVLDAELSVARVRAAPFDQLRRLESTRAQLNESLQRVSYAHSLLSL